MTAEEHLHFIHCRHCLERRPRSVTPRNWGRLEVGVDASGAGVLVRCVRCGREVGWFELAEPLLLRCEKCN